MPHRPHKSEHKNPFSPAFPVHPKFFLNRVEVLNSFRKAIQRSGKTQTPTPDNLAILGDWGIGKTSVLRKFESILLDEFQNKHKFSATIELTPNSCRKNSSFIAKIIDDISRNFAVSEVNLFKEIRNEIREWKAKSNGNEIALENKIKKSSPSAYLRDTLVSLWDTLEKSAEIDTAVLMLDDLHYLTERNPESLYDLGWIFQSLPKYGCNFVLCSTGQRDLFSEVNSSNEHISRFFNLTHTLTSFKLKETKNAILRPLKLSDLDLRIEEEVLERIHDVSAGHPFFIHFIMRELLSFLPPFSLTKKISLDNFEKTYPKIKKILENEKFERDFFLASDKERKILMETAYLPRNFSPSEIQIKNSRTQLRFLLRKNLIIKHDRGEYSLYHPLFREYLRGLRRR
jgi:hypothetical protein